MDRRSRIHTECYVSIDEKGTILALDGNATKIFGYKASEALGANIKVLMPEPFRSNHDSYLKKFVDRGNDTASTVIGYNREVIAIRKDGTPVSITALINIQSKTPDNHYVFRAKIRDMSSERSLDRWIRKSVFEQYLFGLLYALTQDMSAPRPWAALLALFIDFFSILSFNLRPQFPWGPATRGVLAYFVSATSVPLSEVSSVYGYLVVRVVWSIVATFILIAFIDVAYVAWAFKAQKVRFITAVKFLRVFVSYAVTNLFVAILSILLFPLDCQIIGQTVPTLSRFSSVSCWGSQNGPIAGISLVISVMFTMLAWCVSYMPRDPHPSSENILAVSHSYYDVIAVLLRTAQSVMITFLSSHLVVIGAVNFVCAISYLCSFLYFTPHFRPAINCLRAGMYACILWSSVCLAGVLSANDSSSEAYSYVLIAGLVPSFAVGWWLCRLRIWWILRKTQIVLTSQPNASHTSMCPVVHIPPPEPQAQQGHVLGPSFRTRQEDTTPRFSSDLEVELAVRLLLARAIEQRCLDPEGVIREMNIALKEGMTQFPRSGFLMITHAMYSLEVNGDILGGLESFERSKGMHTTMPLRFIMYSRFKDDEAKYQSAAAGEAGLGLVELVQLNNDQQAARKHHLGAVKAIKQMWRALLPDKVDVSVLPDIMQRIFIHQQQADKLFLKMMTTYKESPRMLRSYAMYLHDVKNDHPAATTFYHLADEVEDRNSRKDHKEPSGSEAPLNNADEILVSGDRQSVDMSSSSGTSMLARIKRRDSGERQRGEPVFWLHTKIVVMLILVFVTILASFVTMNTTLATLTTLLARMHENGHMVSQGQRIAYAAQFWPLSNHTVGMDARIATQAMQDAAGDLANMQEMLRDHLLAGDAQVYGPLEDFFYQPSIPMCYPNNGILQCLTTFVEAVQDWVLASKTMWGQNTSCVGCPFLLHYGPGQMFDTTLRCVQLQQDYAQSTSHKALVVSVSMQAGCIVALILVVTFVIHPNVRQSCGSYFQMYAILLKIPKSHVESRLRSKFHIAEKSDEDDDDDDLDPPEPSDPPQSTTHAPEETLEMHSPVADSFDPPLTEDPNFGQGIIPDENEQADTDPEKPIPPPLPPWSVRFDSVLSTPAQQSEEQDNGNQMDTVHVAVADETNPQEWGEWNGYSNYHFSEHPLDPNGGQNMEGAPENRGDQVFQEQGGWAHRTDDESVGMPRHISHEGLESLGQENSSVDLPTASSTAWQPTTATTSSNTLSSWITKLFSAQGASAQDKRVRQLSLKYFGITFIIVWILIGSMIMFNMATQTVQQLQNGVSLGATRSGVGERLRFHLRQHSLGANTAADVVGDLNELISVHRKLLFGSSSGSFSGNLYLSSQRFDLYFPCQSGDPQCTRPGLFNLFRDLVTATSMLVGNPPPVDPFDQFCTTEVTLFEPVLQGLRDDNELILTDAETSVTTVNVQQGIMFAVASLGLFSMYLFVFWPLIRVLKMEVRMMAFMLSMLPPSLVDKVAEIKDFLKSQH